jgi:hypothetical protein
MSKDRNMASSKLNHAYNRMQKNQYMIIHVVLYTNKLDIVILLWGLMVGTMNPHTTHWNLFDLPAWVIMLQFQVGLIVLEAWMIFLIFLVFFSVLLGILVLVIAFDAENLCA